MMNIDWSVNLKNCKEAVLKYTKKWVKLADLDRCALRDWEEMVIEAIERRISYLKQEHVNKRKKHVLRNKVHLT